MSRRLGLRGPGLLCPRNIDVLFRNDLKKLLGSAPIGVCLNSDAKTSPPKRPAIKSDLFGFPSNVYVVKK